MTENSTVQGVLGLDHQQTFGSTIKLDLSEYKTEMAGSGNAVSWQGVEWDHIHQPDDTSLRITLRTLQNGDIFLYVQVEKTAEETFALTLDNWVEDLRYENLYRKPGFDKRYGQNKATGLFSYLNLERGSAVLSKIYYYNVLEENGSQICELLEEGITIDLDQNTLHYSFEKKDSCAAFFVLLSKEKLFRDRGNLNDFMKYYYDSLHNNSAWASFFMLPNGTYTKLPYSVEPFSRDGYGCNLHHSSRRDLMPLYRQTKERFYEDLLANAVLQAQLYHPNENGIFYTLYTSTWLKKDTGISAPYIDTRLNEFYVRSVLELKELSGLFEDFDPLPIYAGYLSTQMERNFSYQSVNGSLIADYFKEETSPAHASLNHQLGTAILFGLAWQRYRQTGYLDCLRKILGFFSDTADRWINPETGDLYYGIHQEDDGEFVFDGQEYIFVTLLDLLECQELCCSIPEMGRQPALDMLIEAKVHYLGNTEYSLTSPNAVYAPGEHIYYRAMARVLYEALFQPLPENTVASPALEKKVEEQRIELQNQDARLQEMSSKYLYERNKADDLYKQLQSMVSKFTYEQSKANQLKEELDRANLQCTKHLQQVEEHKYKLENMTVKLAIFSEQSLYLQKKIAELEEFLAIARQELLEREQNALLADKREAELKSTIQSMQKELDMFHNSKMIKIMRFWIWGVPASMRRTLKKILYALAHFIYKRVYRFPRIRASLSKLNRLLGIIRNPESVIAPQKQQKNTARCAEVRAKTPLEMNVAMIVDEFTYNSFRYECNALPLEPDTWKETFENHSVDFFFCESAWAGVDSLNRPWRGKIYCSERFPRENRGVLLEIISYCKANNIPTVFWNKEDPAHYEDKVHNFVDTALRFDHIFTTSKECVERYKKDYGHNSVHLLMFATQPRLFNPIEQYTRTDDVVFAGSWYNQHPQRCKEMERIFDCILSSGFNLKIYDRQSENDDPNHIFPELYKPYILPRLPHDKMSVAYKGSHYALNINTVVESDTMFARRVFELMSSNTLVISNYSKGIESLFGDDVVFTDGKEPLDLSNAQEKRNRCFYGVLKHHTYQNRFQTILDSIALPYRLRKQQVGLYYKVSGSEETREAVQHFFRVQWKEKFCILVVKEGSPGHILQDLVMEYQGGNVHVMTEQYFCNDLVAALDIQYVMQTTPSCNLDFVSKAMLHYSYLDEYIPVAHSATTPYTFGVLESTEHVLMPLPLFQQNPRPVSVQAYFI